MNKVEDAKPVGFYIPPMPTSGNHHVISKGQKPDFYRLVDLRDLGEGKTIWVDSFEKILVGLYWASGGPIPYAFCTPDRKIRSLDAGCIKMLLNRNPPELEIQCDQGGYIDLVCPSQVMLDRYAKIKDLLVKRIVEAGPEAT